jgi:hypothetical protein
MVEDCLRFRIPINLFPGPIGARGHHAGHGMGKSVLNGGIRLFAASQTIQPVGHVRGLLIAHPSRRKGLIASQQNVFDRPPVVHRRVIFVISFFFDQLPSRAAFATVIDQRRFLAHDARKTGRVIAKARGIADQRAPRIGEQRLKRIWIFPAVTPSENPTAGHYRFRIILVQKIVAEVDSMAHPLVRDAARKILLETELKVELRIKGPLRLVH